MTTICRFETLKIGKKLIYSSGKHDNIMQSKRSHQKVFEVGEGEINV
jgi:hypothetical protein